MRKYGSLWGGKVGFWVGWDAMATAEDQLEIYRNLYVYTMEYCMYPEVVEVDPQEKDGTSQARKRR